MRAVHIYDRPTRGTPASASRSAAPGVLTVFDGAGTQYSVPNTVNGQRVSAYWVIDGAGTAHKASG